MLLRPTRGVSETETPTSALMATSAATPLGPPSEPCSLMDRVAQVLAYQGDSHHLDSSPRMFSAYVSQQHCSPKPFPGPQPLPSSRGAATGMGRQGVDDATNATTSSQPYSNNSSDVAAVSRLA